MSICCQGDNMKSISNTHPRLTYGTHTDSIKLKVHYTEKKTLLPPFLSRNCLFSNTIKSPKDIMAKKKKVLWQDAAHQCHLLILVQNEGVSYMHVMKVIPESGASVN